MTVKNTASELASNNPAIVQDAIVESSEGEAAQQEPEHGEDTIAKVKRFVTFLSDFN